MKKLVFTLILCSFFAASSVFGQQWTGSTNTNGNISRNGNVATTGKIGIGTTNPSSALHLYGYYPPVIKLEHYQSGSYTISPNFGYLDIGFNLNYPSVSGQAIRIGRLSGDYSVSIDMKQKTKFSSTSIFQGQATFNNTVLIKNSRLLLFDGANQIELNSNGLIHAREIEVDLDVIPDYVFADDYDLMSLTELQKFIDLNHHLPNIKSAAEYEAHGSIPLKELNLKLLEKVEELTLYTLEQEKEIEDLKTANIEIKNLKKQMAEMQILLQKISSE